MASFKSGFLWGALIGGITTLLYVPQSGRQTRQDINNFIDQTTEDVNDVRYKLDHLRIAIQRLSNEGLSSVKEATEDIELSLKHFEEENQPRINRIQNRIDDLQATIEKQTK